MNFNLKPPIGAQLNRSHPLAKGMVAAWLMNERSGYKILDATGNQRVGTLVGASWGNAGIVCDDQADRVLLANSNYGLPGSSGATIFMVGAPRVADTLGALVFLDRDGGVSTRIALIYRSTRILGFMVRSNTEGLQTQDAATAWTDGIRGSFAGTVDLRSATISIYLDGLQSSRGSFSFAQTTFANTVASNAGINGIPGQSLYDTMSLYEIVLIFNRALAPQEIASLHANPYQMFEPSIPLWAMNYVAPAGGTSVYSDGIFKFDIRSILSSDLIGKFDIRAILSSDSIYKFDILNQIFSDIIAKYDSRSLVTSDLIAVFDLFSLVQSDVIGKYDIRGAITSDLIAKYDQGGIVYSDLTGIFNLLSGMVAKGLGRLGISIRLN